MEKLEDVAEVVPVPLATLVTVTAAVLVSEKLTGLGVVPAEVAAAL
jgi:hypothetical protein